jgi:hypothetical protein
VLGHDRADDKAKAQGLLDKMAESFNHLSANPNMDRFRSNLKKAKMVTKMAGAGQ